MPAQPVKNPGTGQMSTKPSTPLQHSAPRESLFGEDSDWGGLPLHGLTLGLSKGAGTRGAIKGWKAEVAETKERSIIGQVSR
jgi:hypothetical protein